MKNIYCILIFLFFPFFAIAQEDFINEHFVISDSFPNINTSYGFSVEVLGNYLFVGAYLDDTQLSNAGAVSIYKRTNANSDWVFHKRIFGSIPKANAYFGITTAAYGDYLVVGAENWGSNTSSQHGSVYVFYKNQGGTDNWGEVKKINPSYTTHNANFGISVSIEDDLIMVGASGKKEAYLFQKDLGGTDNWGLFKTFVDASTRSFGEDVKIKDGYALMGGGWYAAYYTSNTGRVNIYGKDQGGINNWGLIKFVEDYANTFGATFDFDGTNLAVNAIRYTGTGSSTFSGRCYVYGKDEGGINNFGLIKEVRPEVFSEVDYFGSEVNIKDDKLIVSARLTGIKRKCYYFQKDLGGTNNWGQKGVLYPTIFDSNDAFGNNIQIDGNIVLVGTPGAKINTNRTGLVLGFNLDSCFTTHTHLYDTILYESTFYFAGQYLDKDGIYTDTLITENGCDSIIFQHLEVESRIQFDDKWDFAAGNGPYDVAIGDLTGDGKNEMVSANYLGNSISLFWNIGSPGVLNPSTFFPSVEITVGNKIAGVEIADISGDGINDIIISSYGNDSIYVFKNIYAGGILNASSFNAPIAYQAGNGPFDLETTDLDGNGKIDVVVINRFDKSVSVYGNYSFANTVFLAPKLDYSLNGDEGYSLAFGDMNNDAKKDILVGNNSGDVLYGFENNGVVGGISFLPYVIVSSLGGDPGSAQVYDFNQDGCNDIIQAFYTSGYQVGTYQNNCATGALNKNNFTYKKIADLTGLITSSVYGLNTRMADLDKNGKDDLVFMSRRTVTTINARIHAFANINNLDAVIDEDDFNDKFEKNYTTNYTDIPYFDPNGFDYFINIRFRW